jgi:hypothetical protein
MDTHAWQLMLVVALALNAALGFGYRVYRLAKGGPMADVIGQAILGGALIALSVAVALDVGWARWPALVYGLLFGLVVMPVWTLAVLIPLKPGAPDYAFTILYWTDLFVIAGAALLW